VLNNTATTVIAAPIAIDIANRLSVNPDPFLMAVAIAASCAFLTPAIALAITGAWVCHSKSLSS
jgi:di/tricarboxylate transporter